MILFKPDCMGAGHVGDVLTRFEGRGYQIVGCKMIHLNDDVLDTHYAHITHLPFFSNIAAFMSSRPVIAMVLQGEDVIQGVRDLLGPTDSAEASAGTIRGDLGTNSMQNVLHASDGSDSAALEIERFFLPGEVFELPA